MRLPNLIWIMVLAAMGIAVTKPLDFICYSPFRDGQAPGGIEPTEAQIQQDFTILLPLVNGVRTYSVNGVQGQIPRLAHAAGLLSYAAAWIGRDTVFNNAEVARLIAVANSGVASLRGLIVGNEVLLRQDITKARLIQYLRQVQAATNLPVTTAEIYQNWIGNLDLGPETDFVLCHIHPYWESVNATQGATHVVNGWNSVKTAYPTKEVIVGETGWPSAGGAMGAAVPSIANQDRFVTDLVLAGAQRSMRFMVFDAFDEQWKTNEGTVGPNWGLYYSNRTEKAVVPHLRTLVVPIRNGNKERPHPAFPATSRRDFLGRAVEWIRLSVTGFKNRF